MTELPAILGVGGSFTLGGKLWHWTPLTLGDEAEMEVEIRAALADRLKIVSGIKEDLDGFAGADRRIVIEAAVREQFRLERMRGIELANEFGLPDLDAILLKYYLRKKHPEVGIEIVRGMMKHEVVQAEIAIMSRQLVEALPGEVSGPRSAGSSASTSPNPKPTDNAAAPGDGGTSSVTSPSTTAGRRKSSARSP